MVGIAVQNAAYIKKPATGTGLTLLFAVELLTTVFA